MKSPVARPSHRSGPGLCAVLRRVGMAAASFLLLSACALLVPEPPNLFDGFRALLDSAKSAPVPPTWDFVVLPDSADLGPIGNSEYVYACTEDHSKGGLGPNYSNAKRKIRNGPAPARKSPLHFGRHYADIPVQGSAYDSLLLDPVADSAYYAAFADSDGKRFVLFRTQWPPPPSTSAKWAYQVFKEGVGLIGEYFNLSEWMDSDTKGCWLSAIDGKPFETLPLLRRLVGMQKAFADSIAKDTAVLVISHSVLDSIVASERYPLTGSRKFAGDTVFRFPGNEFDRFRAWQGSLPEKYFYVQAVDSVVAIGDYFGIRERPPYAFW